jgi:hypothetical protein
MVIERIYPDPVEAQLDALVNVLTTSDRWPTLSIDDIRETFAPTLLDLWISGDESELSDETLLSLIKVAHAKTTIRDLEAAGLIDTISCSDGDHVFLTSKGKKELNEYTQLMQQLLN